MAQNPSPDPSPFVEAVLMRCPDMPTADVEQLRAAVRKALVGRPESQWTEAFADLIIDRRDEPFARPFFQQSVGAGMAATFGYAERGPAGMAALMRRCMPPETADAALALAVQSIAAGSSATDAAGH
ncbi:hypothetical protein ACIOEW_35995 [Streptomyces sp. NPDC087901]|uniref:hypothetical protein n=1 Tax=Streptomyces sp. NPDC087901 TaxID=3365818 RepID=UPI00381DDE22